MGPADSGFVTIGFVSSILVREGKNQSREAHYANVCVVRTNINDTHDQLGWLKVDERLKISILSFLKDIYLYKMPACLNRQLTLRCVHTCTPTDMQLVLNKQLQKINSTSARKWRHTELPYNGTLSKTKSKTNFTKQVKQYFIRVIDNVPIFSKVSSFVVFLSGGLVLFLFFTCEVCFMLCIFLLLLVL